MCVAIFKPAAAVITRAELKNCWNGNPDGGGFMFIKNGKLVVQKGYFSFRKFYKAFRIAEASKSPMVLHCRIATSGGKNTKMCHPFLINETTGFVHNGVLTGKGNAKESDTSQFCRETLAELPEGFHREIGYKRMLSVYAKAELSKFVFLDNEGYYEITNWSAGEWHNGSWYSNSSYEKNNFGFTSYADDTYYNQNYSKAEAFNYRKTVFDKEDYMDYCDYCGEQFYYGGLLWTGDYKVCKSCRPLISGNQESEVQL